MPIIQLKLNVKPEQEKLKAVLREVTRLTADTMEKSFSDIMVLWEYSDIYMDSSFDPAAFIDFRLISGFSLERGETLCRGIAKVLREKAAIDSSRVYIHFIEAHETLAWRFIDGIPGCPAMAVN